MVSSRSLHHTLPNVKFLHIFVYRWISKISYFNYAMDALVMNEFGK